jgi:hypothetical protein
METQRHEETSQAVLKLTVQTKTAGFSLFFTHKHHKIIYPATGFLLLYQSEKPRNGKISFLENYAIDQEKQKSTACDQKEKKV